MYDSKMAIAVKANSRVLREFEDAVYIPFGSEYSLLLKNLNSVRALVRIWIDGTDVTDGTSLVIQPNSSLDLERFIKNGNMSAGNKFKFIERTEAISDHRGNKIDDGLIRVEFEFEKVEPRTNNWPATVPNWPARPLPYYDDLIGRSTFGDQVSYGSGVMGNVAPSAASASCSATGKRVLRSMLKSPEISTLVTDGSNVSLQNDVGITVEGAVSDQKFTYASWFPTDGVKHVMVMRVLGEVEGKQVKAPVTVKSKPVCKTCGTTNKITSKFCAECGTSLTIV